MKYETLIENYHGHCFRNRFEANSDEEAFKKAKEYGYNFFINDDCLWRVNEDYVNYAKFDRREQDKFEKNYTKL